MKLQFKHILGHVILTAGLTLIGGIPGSIIGILYYIGDTVDKSKSRFTDKDFEKFMEAYPDLSKRYILN